MGLLTIFTLFYVMYNQYKNKPLPQEKIKTNLL